jgi:predicted nucleotidyltransferase
LRITETEKNAILTAVRIADAEARIWIFGSRADDAKKGGDIDIAILSQKIKLPERMKIRRSIVDALGEQKIDIVVSATGIEPFFRLATETGAQIDG